MEQVNMLGSGGANKKYENQGGFNELFDTGKVCKVYRDSSKNYGKDIMQLYRLKKKGHKSNKVGFFHIGCMNFMQAHTVCSGKEGLHSMALFDRYMVMPLIFINPYDEPPAGYTPPSTLLINPDGDAEDPENLKRDSNGLWRRDLIESFDDAIQAGLTKVHNFVKQKPNQVMKMSEAARDLLRRVDFVNWKAAGILQYTDENKAARLRQAQRFLAILTAGHGLLDVMSSDELTTLTVENFLLTIDHARRGVAQLAAQWEGHETFLNSRRELYLKFAVWEPQEPSTSQVESTPLSMPGEDVVEEVVAPMEKETLSVDLPQEWKEVQCERWGTYYQNEVTGEYTYDKPLPNDNDATNQGDQCVPVLENVKSKTAPTRNDVPKGEGANFAPRGIDEYTLVGILCPELATKLREGKDGEDSGELSSLFQDQTLKLEAVRATLTWPNTKSISGSSVTAAIKRERVSWPTQTWWRKEIIDGILLPAGVGKVSERNFGGGCWYKPLPPSPGAAQEEHKAFETMLMNFGVSIQEFMANFPTPKRSSVVAVFADDSAQVADDSAQVSPAAEPSEQRSAAAAVSPHAGATVNPSSARAPRPTKSAAARPRPSATPRAASESNVGALIGASPSREPDTKRSRASS
jgi:hypothetical protein